MVNTLHRLEHVRHGFDNLKMAISMWKTKVRRRLIAGVTGWWFNSNSAIVNMINLNHELIEKRPEWTKKWFCYTTMPPRLTHQNWRKTPWNRLDGTCFCPRSNPLTWRHLSPLRINGTRACATSAISKKLEIGSTNGLPQKKNSFSGNVFITWKMVKVCRSRWPIFWINEKWNSLENYLFLLPQKLAYTW